MIIQNFEDLATSEKKRECLEILEAGLKAADPENIIPKFVTPEEIKIQGQILKLSGFSNIYTVAFGKAGDSMTRALNEIIPIKSGIIVIPKGSKSKIKSKKFQIFIFDLDPFGITMIPLLIEIISFNALVIESPAFPNATV